MCRIARHVYIWGASVHAEDWCVACPCVCCACVVFWVHSFIPSSRISTPNEREFMNAFVGKTLAICKCKKKNDKFIVVYPVLGRLCSDCTQSNAPRGERGGRGKKHMQDSLAGRWTSSRMLCQWKASYTERLIGPCSMICSNMNLWHMSGSRVSEWNLHNFWMAILLD